MNESIIKNVPIIFLFGGQGSQYHRMGIYLYEHHHVFRYWMNRCSEILKSIDPDYPWLIDEIYNEPVSLPFKKLKFTHPAIFSVEYALYKALIEEGVEPDFLLGSSLGEFTAVAASDSCDLETALQSVMEQVKIISRYCPRGGMTAVLGSVKIYENLHLERYAALAGINYDNHFTISGLEHELDESEILLSKTGIIYQRLPVEYGFHSSRIDHAESAFKEHIKRLSFKSISLPVLSGIDGRKMKSIPDDYFWNVARKPLNICKIIRELENKRNYEYIDLSPNGTLANFVKYNIRPDSESKYFSVLSAFNIENLNMEKIKNELMHRTLL